MGRVVRVQRRERAGGESEGRGSGGDDEPGSVCWGNNVVRAGLEVREEMVGCWVLFRGGGWVDCYYAGEW